MKINLLNNKKSFCRGIEFNNDKWRLYYLLNKEIVSYEMAFKCANCWIDHSHKTACGNEFIPGVLTNYMFNKLKKHHWK